jgi:SAM-dependent methyltransferase
MEIRVDFQSEDQWKVWRSNHGSSFPAWKKSVVASVRESGFIEPITMQPVDPSDIAITAGNIRESLSHSELNARKRGLLLEFDTLRRQTARIGARSARIFAPEALSRIALILRGLYPYFLGTEFIPDPLKRAHYYPIQHADLAELDMPDAVYDLVIASDSLEHVSDLERALSEIARVLRPGGLLVSTVPFDPEGTAGSRLPSWGILDTCRAVGLTDARMVLHASSIHAIMGDSAPGVFVLSAAKSNGEKSRPLRSWIWNAAKISRVIGVLGFPRSGTTMLTAVLDAHEDVVAIYEPWNAHKKAIAAGTMAITMESLFAEAESLNAAAGTLVIKETTAEAAYSKNVSEILSQAHPPISRYLLLLLRNPFHCFLSEIEGRQKWWGEAGLEVNLAVFDRWAHRTLGSLLQLLGLASAHPSAFVFYETCVSRPEESFEKIMRAIGLPFVPDQLRITEKANLSRIRGDLSLIENARDVGDSSISKRSAEFDLCYDKFSGSRLFNQIERATALFDQVGHCGLIGADDPMHTTFAAALLEIVRTPTPLATPMS